MPVERPLIIRDQASVPVAFGRFLRSYFFILAGVWLYSECRVQVGRDGPEDRWSARGWALFAASGLAVYLVPFLVQRVRHPASLTLGPGGITVRSWLRPRHIRWKDIRHFEVKTGQRRFDISTLGYKDVVVALNDEGRGPWDPESIRLPRFDCYTSEALAELLTKQKRLHLRAEAKAPERTA